MEPLTTNAGEETDITPNRAYSESYGRWLSPDPGGLKGRQARRPRDQGEFVPVSKCYKP